MLAVLGLLGLGGAAATPEGLRLGLPTVPVAAGGLLVLACAALALRFRGAAAPAGLSLVPLLLFLAPGSAAVASWSGPPLLALALAGLAIAAAKGGHWPARRLFFPLVLGLYALVAARVQVEVGPQGDEPHYLMVAESLIRDGDLSLERDYAEARYAPFFARRLEPHYRVRGRDGEIYSLHALGLSLLVLPAYALGGYPAASLFMALLAAWLACELRELVREALGQEGLAEGLGWLLALSPPLVHYAGLVFTEVPAALGVALALRHGREPARRGWAGLLGLGTVLAFLPWLNVRNALLAALLALYVLSRIRGWRRGLAVVAPIVASAAASAAYHSILYGFLDPRRVYGRRPEFALGTLAEGLPGLLLDQEFGLLVYAPIFALAAPGLAALLRRSPRLGAVVALLILGVLVTAGSWHMWRGGFNPPARFLVPLLPALALALGAALRQGLGAGAALLVGWSLFTGLTGAVEPRLVHRDRDGTAPLFRAASGAHEWTRLLPAYVLAEPDRHELAGVWAGALGLAVLARRGPSSARGLLVGSGVLVAAAGLGARLSDGVSEGRDAVRLIGRPSLELPGWRFAADAPAHWDPTDLGWGPAYEPHRWPDGAVVGGRLPLPPGDYRLRVAGQEPPPAARAPELRVLPEGRDGSIRVHPLRREAGLVAEFAVRSGERAVTLCLAGGGPLLLERVRLERLDLRFNPGVAARSNTARGPAR